MKKNIILIIILFISFSLLGCSKQSSQTNTTIQNGSKINISYSASFENGDLFEKVDNQDMIVGSGEMIVGIEEGVINHGSGDNFSITITPDQGYGSKYDANKIQDLNSIIFDRLAINPELGKEIIIGDLKGTIKNIETIGTDKIISIDLNPKETFNNLIYSIKINKIY